MTPRHNHVREYLAVRSIELRVCILTLPSPSSYVDSNFNMFINSLWSTFGNKRLHSFTSSLYKDLSLLAPKLFLINEIVDPSTFDLRQVIAYTIELSDFDRFKVKLVVRLCLI